MTDQVGAMLDELALRFGATGVHLWEQLVFHRTLSASAGIAFGTLLVVVSLWGVRFSYDKRDWEPGVILACTCALIGAIVCFANVPGLLAPEGSALLRLLRTLR